MDGKELLELLDFVKKVQEEAKGFEERVKKENLVEAQEKELKSKAIAYREVAERLETLLRKLNPYEQKMKGAQ